MTRKQWEDYCLDKIKRQDGRFSVFWATENKFIACAMDRLTVQGRLKTKKLGFPYFQLLRKTK